MYFRPCKNACGQRLFYDGQEDGIFNHSNHTLFSYEAMLTYWDGIVSSKLSFTAHHSNMHMAHCCSSTANLLPKRAVVREALQGFMLLLDIDYSSFGCPCCSKLPHGKIVVIIDGTTLGSRKDLVMKGGPQAVDTQTMEPIPDL